MNIKEITTDRGLFSYREYGKTDGNHLVTIHGWPETSYCWHHAALHLQEKYHIISVDLRGAGGSNRDLDKSKYGKDHLALDVISMLDQLGIDSFYLAGHDWGGGVAQEIAFKVASRIKKLCVLDFPIITNHIGQAAAYKVLGKKLFYPFWYQFFLNLRDLPEALIAGKEEVWVRFFMRGMASDIPEESVMEYVKSYQVEGSITCAANLYRTMSSDIVRWKSLQDQMIEIPTLIIRGSKDPVIIEEYFEGIENCISDVQLKSIEAGHFVVDEQPKEVASLLSAFFS